MAKGWRNFATINDITNDRETPEQKKKRFQNADKMIRNISKGTILSLEKEAKELLDKKEKDKNFLLNGYNQKKLKSKKLIDQAKKISPKNKKES